MTSFRSFRLGRLPLLASTLFALVLGATGCSGGGGDAMLTGSAYASTSLASTDSLGLINVSGSGAWNGSAVANLPPPAPIQGASTLRVTSAAGGVALPFTAGYAFRQGDVPVGNYVTASAPGLRGFQAEVKNRWHDGSVKFAIVSGLIDLPAGSEQTVQIGQTGTAPAGAPLGLSDLKATGVTASIAYGAYGTASWTGADWDAPFLSWITGSEMSSWLYRKPIGSDDHLVAWMEVRLYRGGAVEVVPWIENGYLLKPNPGERSGNASFVLNGSTRFSGGLTLYNHTRAVLAGGQILSHWTSGDPAVSFRHDTGYLQLTGMVPAYRAMTPTSAGLYSRIATDYTPVGQHNFPNGMGSGGFHPSIGPLPEWDVVYLTSGGDPRAWRSVQVHGYAAGRYGYHFRDESTNRAPRLTAYPNLVLGGGSGISGTGASTKNQYTPAPSGGSAPAFTNSHMPAIGFMAYLVTGRWYFMDEMQLLSGAMFLKQNDAGRGFTQGIIQSSAGSNTTRGAAWTLRALAHAAAMTPDGDEPLRSELVGSVQHNIDWHHARYVAQPNNPLGLLQPYSDYSPGDGKSDSAAWMEDFLTWSIGNIKSVQAYGPSYGTKLDQFLAWKYRSIVGRLGPNQPGQWSFRNAAAYTVPYAPSESADYAGGAGPWYANWGEAYAAAGLTYQAGTTLLGSYIDGEGLASSYWGNLQPAIAYAVEHGAAGAIDAYNRMVGADNWRQAATYFDSDTPVWSVRPRNVAY